MATIRIQNAMLYCIYAHELPSSHKNKCRKNVRFNQRFCMLKRKKIKDDSLEF